MNCLNIYGHVQYLETFQAMNDEQQVTHTNLEEKKDDSIHKFCAVCVNNYEIIKNDSWTLYRGTHSERWWILKSTHSTQTISVYFHGGFYLASWIPFPLRHETFSRTFYHLLKIDLWLHNFQMWYARGRWNLRRASNFKMEDFVCTHRLKPTMVSHSLFSPFVTFNLQTHLTSAIHATVLYWLTHVSWAVAIVRDRRENERKIN